jgi:GTP-binding protein
VAEREREISQEEKKKRSESEFRVVEAEFLAAGSSLSNLTAPALPEIAFAGRSNVGKSSLMNALMQRKKLVRTSSTPGCTRTLNLFKAKLANGLELELCDLPGYGYAKLSKAESKAFRGMVEGYLRGRPSLVALVILVDARRGLEQEEHELIEFMDAVGEGARSRKVHIFVCATKLDKLPRAKHKTAIVDIAKAADLPKGSVLGVSAVTGEGMPALWSKFARAISGIVKE